MGKGKETDCFLSINRLIEDSYQHFPDQLLQQPCILGCQRNNFSPQIAGICSNLQLTTCCRIQAYRLSMLSLYFLPVVLKGRIALCAVCWSKLCWTDMGKGKETDCFFSINRLIEDSYQHFPDQLLQQHCILGCQRNNFSPQISMPGCCFEKAEVEISIFCLLLTQ